MAAPADSAEPRARIGTRGLRKVSLGRSGLEVTEACCGTMCWGSFNGEEAQAHAQMDRMVALGVNFFDTAELYPVAWDYGKTTEQWMGNWLADRTASGAIARKDLVIATKCNPNGVGGTGKPHGFVGDALEASCRASIERLQCEYVDLYQLHWPTRDTPVFGCASFHPGRSHRAVQAFDEGDLSVFEDQVRSIGRLLELGLIKHWGLSNENAYGVTIFCTTCDRLGVPRPVTLQNDFSLTNRIYEADTLEACHRFGVVGLPYGCLAGGILTGKYDNPEQFAKDPERGNPSDWRHNKCKDFQPRYFYPLAVEAGRAYAKLAAEWGLTPLQLALAWARDKWFNASIITGTASVKQCEECVAALSLEALPEELNAAVDKIHEEYRSPAVHLNDKAHVLTLGSKEAR
uniref:NADP-dependent oxidoreductase domain-containing protein n=1 Tax=Prasinoderma coloniale TaxID=156133 RepID=A0A7R9TV05_9VIRI|mmetsp:Transcript_6904/g.28268  ORF Transcript_6904/g.28268 Transcript_6904/m.28268 type:complete len:403 (+) Transcript_6904:62-1270(+)|eukprot:PRCOL_00006219-RA